MKTNELTGAALDWAVAQADGAAWAVWRFKEQHADGDMCYSTDWSQGGPIIEREIDSLYRCRVALDQIEWEATAQGNSECVATGPNPLVAAMRCYVASVLGDTVKIPEELL